MNALHSLITRRWILPVAIVLLIAAHLSAAIFLRHKLLTTSVVSGVIVLFAITHLGVFGSFYAWFQRRSGK
jgi:hypothetical protein